MREYALVLEHKINEMKKRFCSLTTIQRFLLAACVLFAALAQAEGNPFADKLVLLRDAGFKDKITIAAEMADMDHPRVRPVLQALLDSRLYVRKSDDRVVITTEAGDGYQIEDAASGDDLGSVGKRDVKKIRTNNALRSSLREILALLNISNADASVRLAAAEELVGNLNESSAQRLRPRLATEKDGDILSLMESAIAIVDLDSADKNTVSNAITTLRGNIHPKVRAALKQTVQKYDGNVLADEAKSALTSIQARLDFYAFLETLFFGLSLGSILALAAIGLAITFGVMGVINMAHGELIMLGAYTTYFIQSLMPNQIEISLLLAVPLAFLVSGTVGILIERGVIRFLYGRPLETLLATFGISLILQQLVRTFVSAQNVAVITPEWLSGSWQINSVLSLTYNRLYIFIFSLLVFAALFVLLKYTSLGLRLRAVSQNRAIARTVGIRSEWVDAMTFGLGSGIAGIAGVALSQLTNVGPNLGQGYIIDSFMVVVFGGVGNLIGTLISGLTLGIANKFLEPVSGAVLAKILVLVFIILFIQKRPRGLFPQKGRAADS